MKVEKLNLWDRLFNRYAKTIHQRGSERWQQVYHVHGIQAGEPCYYTRAWIEYKIVDRLTGSETIERDYIN